MNKQEKIKTYAKLLSFTGYNLIRLHSVDQNGICTCYKKEDCSAPGKHPSLPSGYKPTSDFNIIEGWLNERPNSNIGVATGKISGIEVMDIDPKNGGNESFQYLWKQFGSALISPFTVLTGSGGLHIYFQYTGSYKKKTLLPGIDWQSDGKYVVAPPSIHKTTNEYRPINILKDGFSLDKYLNGGYADELHNS